MSPSAPSLIEMIFIILSFKRRIEGSKDQRVKEQSKESDGWCFVVSHCVTGIFAEWACGAITVNQEVKTKWCRGDRDREKQKLTCVSHSLSLLCSSPSIHEGHRLHPVDQAQGQATL